MGKLTQDLQALSPERAIVLKNDTCAYCNTPLTKANVTNDHLIGRRFVPKGKLHNQWNLIVRCCHSCNNKKSSLEDDISAVSMQPDAYGRFPDSDPVLLAEAERKGNNSISRRTRKPVKDSAEKFIHSSSPDSQLRVKASFVGPPQVDSDRVYELSRLQICGLFYWLTYNHETRKGGYWLGNFFPIMESVRSDWGNPTHKAFMNEVIQWEPRLIATGADGYFQVAIRRRYTSICWSWALEWNNKYRVFGLFGEPETVKEVVKALPKVELVSFPLGETSWFAFRAETPLADEDDKMFMANPSESI